MNNVSADTQPPTAPTFADSQLALETGRRLTQLLANEPLATLCIRVARVNEPEELISVPLTAFQLLNSVLHEMGKGNAVALIPVHTELSTLEAAVFLNVSPPFLIEQLEKGVIPHRKDGVHRRVILKDLMEFKQSMEHNRLKSLKELSAIDQEVGFGY